MSKRIGIFGGTFDPVHLGHIHAAKSLCEECQLEQVFFVPAANPVHRESPQATTEQRLMMLNLALSDYQQFTLDAREVSRGGPSYSVLTMQEYRTEYPHHTLFFIIGSDAFNGIDTWYQWQTIFDCVNLVVLGRPGHQLQLNAAVDELLADKIIENLEQLNEQTVGKIYLSKMAMLVHSATQVRAMMQQNQSLTDIVPEKVAHFIKENNIYC